MVGCMVSPRVILLLCVGLLVASDSRAESGRLQVLDRFVRQAMSDWDVPGLTIAVVEEGMTKWTKGYGVRHLDRRDPVDENTLFGLGSTSKAFATTTVAILVEDGKLSWEDRVVTHVPWFRLPDPWTTYELRIRDILVAHAGTGSTNQLRPVAKNRRDYLERLRFRSTPFPFRSRYGYSNDMYILTGQLVEEVTGGTWDDFAKKHVWEPLGMATTTSRMSEARSNPNHATPHVFPERFVGAPYTPGRSVRPIAWEYEDDIAVPSGGVASNARDMARWLLFHLGQFEGGDRILSDQARRMLHSPQTVVQEPAATASRWWMLGEEFPAYAMGWQTGQLLGQRIVTHGGEGAGINTCVAFLPEVGFGVFVSTNRQSYAPFMVAKFAVASFLGKVDDRDWQAEYKDYLQKANETAKAEEKKRLAGRIETVGPSLPDRAYTGTYRSDSVGTLQIKQDRGALVAELEARDSPMVFTLEPWHIDQFLGEWSNMLFYFSFRIDELGRVTGLAMDSYGDFTRDSR